MKNIGAGTAMLKRIRIYRWRAAGLGHNNFGDELTLPILQRLFGAHPIPSRMEQAELIAAGSILDAWERRPQGIQHRLQRMIPYRRARDLHVWGSGFILPDSEAVWPQQLHFHAVRGALTAERIANQVPLGDPGILAGLILDRHPSKQYAVGLVPHHSDVDAIRAKWDLPADRTLVDPCDSVDKVLTKIASCELIVSSSLHGLITADSFGIPCVWARTVQPLYGSSNFKFADYASARGAPFNEPIEYERAFRNSPAQLAELATVPGRSIEQWQQELIAAFPRDL